MTSRASKFALPAAIATGCGFALYTAASRPAYFSNADQLASLLFFQVLIVAIWRYRARFFAYLLIAFLWAGTGLPLSAAWTSGRWLILAAGALVGIVVYINSQHHRFTTFHLIAFFCVVAAVVSAAVSAYSTTAFLKATSLLLLFLYGSCGARVAVMGREATFFSRLLTGCEVLVYITAIAYFGFQYQIYGNPNSLGAIMGVAVAPIMLWGILISERPGERLRRTSAFLLALVLLFSSYARAGIVAAIVSCVLLCLALRRYGLLLRGVGAALLLALLVSATVPLRQGPSDSLTSSFVYKGRRDEGILASRRSVWDDAVSAIEEHPWLGSGFGTSKTSSEVVHRSGSFESLPQATREHGNSYLAITEWVGFVGDIPFLALVILVVANLIRGLTQVRRTGDVFSPLIPLVGVLAAGLVHAAFEDWLFAVGYYLCVFFWTLAFVMDDIVPAAAPAPVPTGMRTAQSWINDLGVAPSRP